MGLGEWGGGFGSQGRVDGFGRVVRFYIIPVRTIRNYFWQSIFYDTSQQATFLEHKGTSYKQYGLRNPSPASPAP